jgi:hypothetical protein
MSDMDHESEWLTVAEAAILVDRPPVTVRRWARQGLLESEKSGAIWLVRREPLLDLVREGPAPTRLASLSDRPSTTLGQAWARVSKDVERDDLPDIVEHHDFGANVGDEIRKLSGEIGKGYKPRQVRILEMPKSGFRSRPLAQLTIEDRLVYEACVQSIASGIDSRLHRHVYNHRVLKHPQKSRLVRHFAGAFGAFERYVAGDAWTTTGAEVCLIADVASFYEYVDHEVLVEMLDLTPEQLGIAQLLKRLLFEWRRQEPVIGLPQGADASGILANAYLSNVDSICAANSLAFARFSDDMRIFFKSEQDASRFAPKLVKGLRQLGLNLSGTKTETKTISELISDEGGKRRAIASYKVDSSNITSLEDLRSIFDSACADPRNISATDLVFSVWRLGLLEDEYPLNRILELLPDIPFAAKIVADYVSRLGYIPDVLDALSSHLLSADNIYEWSEIHLLRAVGRFDEVGNPIQERLRSLAEGGAGPLGDFATRVLGSVGTPSDRRRLRNLALRRDVDPFRRRAALIAAAELSGSDLGWLRRLRGERPPPEVRRAAGFVVSGRLIPSTLPLRRVPGWVAPLRAMLEEEGKLPPRQPRAA